MRRNGPLVIVLGLFLSSCGAERQSPRQPVLQTSKPASLSPPAQRPSALTLTPVPSPPPGTVRPPEFSMDISSMGPGQPAASWRPGCPVGPEDLRMVSVGFWGFDDRPHTGRLVIHRDHAANIVSVMQKLYEQRFPIEKMEPIDKYGGDDDRSMDANNTSAFNCREIKNRPGVWSEHAFGGAIDINPVQNPFVSDSGRVSPAAGAPFAVRSRRSKGMIHPNDAVVAAFRSVGWKWGGEWPGAKDYQHFSRSGR